MYVHVLLYSTKFLHFTPQRFWFVHCISIKNFTHSASCSPGSGWWGHRMKENFMLYGVLVLQLLIHLTAYRICRIDTVCSRRGLHGYSEEDIVKWNKVFVCDLMSSEESGEDEVIIVRPLPWRNRRVDELFVSPDDQLTNERSAQAKRQMKRRTIGSASSRPEPVAGSLPPWALK